MKVSESGYTKDELLDIVDKYLAEQSRRWNFIEEKVGKLADGRKNIRNFFE